LQERLGGGARTDLEQFKAEILLDIDRRLEDKIIEKSNADLLKKLVNNAESRDDALSIAELGTTYKKTGFHFSKRLEKNGNDIKFYKKNTGLSFIQSENNITHKLIIGDNYDVLLNLLIAYREKINLIYIDPPYGKDDMGEFAKTNYENAITRDNLLSMLYPRLVLARQLLSDDGIIFCSIDDRNQAYVKGLFDDIFGEINFVSQFIINKTAQGANQSSTFKQTHEYVLCYKKYSSDMINTNTKAISDKKYKYSDDKGMYAITNGFDSINSPLIENKNRDIQFIITKKLK
jgi:adenine-specific DNA-methyltransferase